MMRIERPVDTHVFHAFLRFETRILADEKDKKKFLDFALKCQKKEPFSILAFAVLDDSFHALLSVRETADPETAADARVRSWEAFLTGGSLKKMENVQCASEKIGQWEDLPEVCRQIHMLPIVCGYAKQLRDYWWSSYQTYRGWYQWKNLDTVPVLACFGKDEKKSRMLFRRYHRCCGNS